MNRFRKIVITTPDERPGEAEEIAILLDTCIDTIHLRKPDWSELQMRGLIEEIPTRLHHRLRLHLHFRLVDEYGLAGPHLNHRWPKYEGTTGTLSSSCHYIDELADNQRFEYQTLSPIFNSLSKQSYVSSFNLKELPTHLQGKSVIALGGVAPEHFSTLADCGFAGAAMLGYVWGATCREELLETIKRIQQCSNL